MFVRVDGGADGTGGGSRPAVGPKHAGFQGAGTVASLPRDVRGIAEARAQEPSEDQTSNFVLMRSTTADVNSVVEEWPPRSGVLVPDAIVSSAPS
jgi:hypothetical protein